MSSHKRVLECGMRRVNLEVPSRRARSVSATYACNFFFSVLFRHRINNTELSREQVNVHVEEMRHDVPGDGRGCLLLFHGSSCSRRGGEEGEPEPVDGGGSSRAAEIEHAGQDRIERRWHSFKWREEKRTSLV